MPGSRALAVVAGIALVVLLPFGLLYAYRTQAPATQTISYPAAIDAVQQGRVHSVRIEGDRVTLTLNDGTTQHTDAPDAGALALRSQVEGHNRADPAHPTDLRYGGGDPGIFGLVPLLLSLIPLLILVAFVCLAALALAHARAPQRYEALARLADLRDRGALTEDEFQREKLKILK